MSKNIRALVKRVMPPQTRNVVESIRGLVAKPPIDDIVLADLRLQEDADATPRLNLLVPNLRARSVFGGVLTGLDIFQQLAALLQGERELDIRVIFGEPDRETDENLFLQSAVGKGLDPARISFVRITDPQQAIAVRRADIFVSYNWWLTLNAKQLVDAQASHFGQPVRPLVYLIQEYEPHLMDFSSAHMLARAAYDQPARLWGIFNSTNLHEYFQLQGHSSEQAFVFDPVINDKLRPYLPQVVGSRRAKQMLVYGRPNVPRNCFPALVRGLRRWAMDYPAAAEWDVISAGKAHAPIPLAKGKAIRSVGKLSLDDYAKMLMESSVGVSLMASPHPSYPPLEMAHMGLRVVTNSYLCKDLSTFHPDIVSTGSIAERDLAAAISEACDRAAEPPSGHCNADYVREDLYPFMNDLASALGAEFG